MTPADEQAALTVARVLIHGVSPKVAAESWAAGQLMKAGIEWPTAVRLAVSPDVDWHDVLAALEQGATPEQAARIFLP